MKMQRIKQNDIDFIYEPPKVYQVLTLKGYIKLS